MYSCFGILYACYYDKYEIKHYKLAFLNFINERISNLHHHIQKKDQLQEKIARRIAENNCKNHLQRSVGKFTSNSCLVLKKMQHTIVDMKQLLQVFCISPYEM